MISFKRILLGLSLIIAASCEDNPKGTPVEELEIETQTIEAEAPDDVVVTVEGNPELGTFAAKMNYVNALDTLENEGPFTIFAPNNLAYSTIFKEHGEEVFDPDNEEVIMYHIAKGAYTTDRIREEIEGGNGSFAMETMQGEDIVFTTQGDSLVITGGTGNTAYFVRTDIEASNGVVHVIDAVLLPYEIKEKAVVTN